MIVVSNTSPLIALSEAGLLDLLPKLYESVTLPGAVFDEVTVAGAGAPGADDIREAAWVTTLRLDDTSLLRALKLELDPGESEAIACAVQLRADWVLIDERRGRLAAERLGLRVMGTMGILIAAKRAGHLLSIKAAVDDLRNRAGFWISDALVRRVLIAAGEP